MTVQAPALVRLCPNCRSERPVSEFYCENIVDGGRCSWHACGRADSNRSVLAGGATSPAGAIGRRCINGHDLGQGDEICLVCGADPATTAVPSAPNPEPPGAPPEETVIDGWHVLRRACRRGEPWERFVVRDQRKRAPKRFLPCISLGAEPDPAVHEVLRRMPRDHIPELIATGRFQERAYEVAEAHRGERFKRRRVRGRQPRCAATDCRASLVGALAEFAEVGLRHRDIRPGTILLREREPLDLVVTDFGSARLSDFDLESVAPLEVTRYSAPESIVGAVSAASDWWSLGMIVLEQATAGACFAGVNEKAFLIHVVTRGVDLPNRS